MVLSTGFSRVTQQSRIPPPAFRPLRPQSAVAFDPVRCLRLRSRYSDCERCAEACPAKVLRVTGAAIELGADCLRCGRCSAVCPTGALQTAGFAVNPRRAAAGTTPLYVDCWKVPASDSARDAVRVPCLGGIAVHQLLQWHAAAEGRVIALVDRGWCSRCRAGRGARHPAQEALDAARALLAELGVAECALPRFESLPPPRTQMPVEIPQPVAAQSLSRREFFAGITRRAARAIAPVTAGQPEEDARSRRARLARIETTARSRLLAEAAALGARRGRPLPAELFPALRVSDACRDHQVCAAACPTGALHVYRGADGAVGTAFDARRCIACGDCTRACPEQALTLMPQGDGEVPRGATALRRCTLRECRDCGHEFVDSGSSEICASCRKTRSVARSSFLQLFPPARGVHGGATPSNDRPDPMDSNVTS
ncbi:MAG: 4Fe-4S binding protein [Betaproteobacteria bacterium]|nr:4Fe-4S binding protein [Betaproteobacteria bacterium]